MPTFTEEIEADAPILWTPFGEDSGAVSASDISGYGRNAAYQGDVTFGLPKIAPGLPGTSVSLGIEGYASWAAASWQRGTTLSAEIWFIRNTWSGTDSLVNLFGLYLYDPPGPTSYRGWSLGIYRNFPSLNINGWSASAGVSFSDNHTSGVATGAVHQAVYTMDPVTFDMKAYLDGQYAGTTNIGAALTNDPCPLVVGGRLDFAPTQHADNLRVQHGMLFDQVLSADRVLAHWLAGTRRALPPPLRRWPAVDNGGAGPTRHWPRTVNRRAGGTY